MAEQRTTAPPKRKEPGLIGKGITSIVQLTMWLLVSWLLSLVIEWGGMATVWPERGAGHARSVFESDRAFLHPSIDDYTRTTKTKIISWTEQAANKVNDLPWFRVESFDFEKNTSPGSRWQRLTNQLKARYQRYIESSQWVTQTFIVRLALIVFSLPLFFCAIWVGAVDGLVQRDLRRWGGGGKAAMCLTWQGSPSRPRSSPPALSTLVCRLVSTRFWSYCHLLFCRGWLYALLLNG